MGREYIIIIFPLIQALCLLPQCLLLLYKQVILPFTYPYLLIALMVTAVMAPVTPTTNPKVRAKVYQLEENVLCSYTFSTTVFLREVRLVPAGIEKGHQAYLTKQRE